MNDMDKWTIERGLFSAMTQEERDILNILLNAVKCMRNGSDAKEDGELWFACRRYNAGILSGVFNPYNYNQAVDDYIRLFGLDAPQDAIHAGHGTAAQIAACAARALHRVDYRYVGGGNQIKTEYGGARGDFQTIVKEYLEADIDFKWG